MRRSTCIYDMKSNHESALRAKPSVHIPFPLFFATLIHSMDVSIQFDSNIVDRKTRDGLVSRALYLSLGGTSNLLKHHPEA